MSKNKNYIHIKENDSKYFLYSELLDIKDCKIIHNKDSITINLINILVNEVLITSDLRLPNLSVDTSISKINDLSLRSDVDSLNLKGNFSNLYIGAQGLVYLIMDLNTPNLEDLYLDLVHIGKLNINTKNKKLLITCFMSDIEEINTNQKNLEILTSEKDNQILCNQKFDLGYFDIG